MNIYLNMDNLPMKMKNKIIFSILALLAIVLSACDQVQPIPITNFEECARAGNPITESIPRQCNANGKNFIEKINGAEQLRYIDTGIGNLTLKFSNGETVLSGTLQRPNPCTNFEVQLNTKVLTYSIVEFKINRKSAAEVCTQVLGKPQKIEAKSPGRSIAGPDVTRTLTPISRPMM